MHYFLGRWRYIADWLYASESDNYRGLLRWLTPRFLPIKEKRRGKLTKVPLLLHDNAPAHRSHVEQAAILESGFEEMLTHHILLIWHRVITICFQIWSNTSVDRDFRPMMSSSMRPKSGWRSSQNSSISQALRDFDNAINCALTKVITLKNKCMLINLSLLYIG